MAISGLRKERCCDAKQLLLGSVRGRETGERERGGRGRNCCEVKQILDMWGVPTDKLLVCHLISSL
jgi:hypothetical protein